MAQTTFTNTVTPPPYTPGAPGTYQTGAPTDPTARKSYGPMAGWDQGKMNDPTKIDPKYALGRALSGLAPTPENLQKVAQQLGYTYTGGDSVRLPDGTTIDAINGLHGSNPYWQFLVPGGGSAPLPGTNGAPFSLTGVPTPKTVPFSSLLPATASQPVNGPTTNLSSGWAWSPT